MRLYAIGFASLLVACSGGSSDDVVDARDAGVRDIGPREQSVQTLDVTEEIVFGLNSSALVGDNAVMRQQDDGRYVIAYGVVPSGEVEQEVHFAERTGPNTWTTEVAARPGEAVPNASGTLVGLGFDLVQGVPHVVYLGGDDDANVLTPFPTDLALATRRGGTWSTTVLVDTSDEAGGPCRSGQNLCNFGNVVGSHPAIRADGASYAVVYRDTHGGFADTDLGESDVEVYHSDTGPSLVDSERSGGSFGDIAFKPDGSVVVGYYLYRPDPAVDRVGIWVAYGSPGSYETRRVSTSGTSSKVSIAVASDGTIYLAFFALDARDLVLATSTDGGDTWTTEAVDASGQTGLHPSLALDPQDEPVIAYTYCGATSDRDCPGTLGEDAEVRLARREGGEWKRFRIADGQGFGGVGLFNSLVVGADGKAAVAFQDSTNSDLVFVEED